jgi:predicted metal-dependent hydrolase
VDKPFDSEDTQLGSCARKGLSSPETEYRPSSHCERRYTARRGAEKVERILKLWKQRTKDYEKIYKQGQQIIQEINKLQNRQTQLGYTDLQYSMLLTLENKFGTNKNLTINTLLKHLSNKLIEYVILREMTHSQERKHNERFWKIISKKIKEHQKREKDLLVYWFLVQTLTLSNQQILL